jgi:hypothetical protein
MNSLEELLNNIYTDIRKKNSERSPYSIPLSDEIYEQNAKKYSLLPFSVPALFKILVDSHRVFQFKIVEADRKERIRRIDGFVVTEGNVVKSLIEVFTDELIREFSDEFSKRYTVEKIMKELMPKINDYNNTSLGKAANVVINLMSFQSLLERNIMHYGVKWQEKQLKIELEKCGPIENFIDIASGGGAAAQEVKNETAGAAPEAGDRQAADRTKLRDFKSYSSKESLGKTLTVYGVEFYTRVCFRDNQYALVQKLVDDGVIKEKEDLISIKKLLQKERMSSDTNMDIQKYANEINNLEKSINLLLKQG